MPRKYLVQKRKGISLADSSISEETPEPSEMTKLASNIQATRVEPGEEKKKEKMRWLFSGFSWKKKQHESTEKLDGPIGVGNAESRIHSNAQVACSKEALEEHRWKQELELEKMRSVHQQATITGLTSLLADNIEDIKRSSRSLLDIQSHNGDFLYSRSGTSSLASRSSSLPAKYHSPHSDMTRGSSRSLPRSRKRHHRLSHQSRHISRRSRHQGRSRHRRHQRRPAKIHVKTTNSKASSIGIRSAPTEVYSDDSSLTSAGSESSFPMDPHSKFTNTRKKLNRFDSSFSSVGLAITGKKPNKVAETTFHCQILDCMHLEGYPGFCQ